MKRTKPPFRADHVGSLLRPEGAEGGARETRPGRNHAGRTHSGRRPRNQARDQKQEEVGLLGITDGEFRRSWWHLDFLWGLDGADKHVMDTGIAFAAVNTRNEGVQITGQARHGRASTRWSSISSLCTPIRTAPPKITIPAPSAIYGRPSKTPINPAVYRSNDQMFADLGQAYRKVSAAVC